MGDKKSSAEIKKQIDQLSINLALAQEVYKQHLEEIDNILEKKREVNLQKYNSSLQIAISKYKETYEDLQQNLNLLIQGIDLSEQSWESKIWDTYFPSIKNSIPKNFRIGEFTYNGKYGSFTTPAIIPIIGSKKNILIKSKGSQGKDVARQLIRALTLRLVSLMPVGKLRLICIDPIGPGITTAGFIKSLPLSISGGQAWFETRHIEEELSKLEIHKATVIQKYLGVTFQDIEKYNQNAGLIEEPYRLLIVSDFPRRFSESAAQTLASITSNGPEIGVYSIIMMDTEASPIYNFNINDLEKNSHIIYCTDQSSEYEHPIFRKCTLIPDGPPVPSQFLQILDRVNQISSTLDDIKVDFSTVLEDKKNWWKSDASQEIQVPIGQFGARERVIFKFDHKLLSSALIIGRQGSGKSTLLHTFISSTCVNYSPEEVEFYLIDMKYVEFKVYANNVLPHARVIAIQADREFALSVLRKVNDEISTREKDFRDSDAVNLVSYRKKSGKKIPRVILVIDEFQEIFGVDDNLTQEASRLLDRIVKIGRAFGINLILASQSLRGYTFSSLDSSTKDLIPIRIGLQCSDLDARMIMNDDNNQASLLERPGEAIFNIQNGRVEGNQIFQVYWQEDESRDLLISEIRKFAQDNNYSPIEAQVVFDGGSKIPLSSNTQLGKFISNPSIPVPQRIYRAWVGEPVDLKSHLAAEFHQQSGSNLLILGQREYEKQINSIIISCLISLIAQNSTTSANFSIFNFNDSSYADLDNDYIEYFSLFKEIFSNPITIINSRDKVPVAIHDLYKELIQRAKNEKKKFPKLYVIIIGLHAMRDVRWNEYYDSESEETVPLSFELLQVIKDGSDYGIHAIVWCDTVDNLNRAIGSSNLSEFDMRVGFRMSEESSRDFLDNRDIASKLEPNRCVYFDVEHMVNPEKFRPYDLPDIVEIKDIGGKLSTKK